MYGCCLHVCFCAPCVPDAHGEQKRHQVPGTRVSGESENWWVGSSTLSLWAISPSQGVCSFWELFHFFQVSKFVSIKLIVFFYCFYYLINDHSICNPSFLTVVIWAFSLLSLLGLSILLTFQRTRFLFDWFPLPHVSVLYFILFLNSIICVISFFLLLWIYFSLLSIYRELRNCVYLS